MFSRDGLLHGPDTHPGGKHRELRHRECDLLSCFVFSHTTCSCSQFSQLYIWSYFAEMYAPLPLPSFLGVSDARVSVSQLSFSRASSSAFGPSTSLTHVTVSSRARASPTPSQTAEVARAWPLSASRSPHLPSSATWAHPWQLEGRNSTLMLMGTASKWKAARFLREWGVQVNSRGIPFARAWRWRRS